MFPQNAVPGRFIADVVFGLALQFRRNAIQRFALLRKQAVQQQELDLSRGTLDVFVNLVPKSLSPSASLLLLRLVSLELLLTLCLSSFEYPKDHA